MITRIQTASGLHAIGVAPATEEVRKVCPWAKCVVVGAVNYLPASGMAPKTKENSGISIVARSADYHDVVRRKLQIAAGELKITYPGARVETCVDFAQFPERKLAILAGIAAPCKSTNVAVEGCGTFAALGEIVTDADIAINETVQTSPCGDCTLCISSCPASALSESGLDPVKCLSRVTQDSGVIPREVCEILKERIYGCDTCQTVCPLNQSVTPNSADFPNAPYPDGCINITSVISMDRSFFERNIRHTAIGWIGANRLRRNAIIAAGNVRLHEAKDEIAKQLLCSSAQCRAAAAYSLSVLDADGALTCLAQALENEADPDCAEEIRKAMSKTSL